MKGWRLGMSREIRALDIAELGEVGRFLADGFGAPADAEFASVEVLAWKFFDPRGGPNVPRGHVAREEGRIVGFVGICPGTFHVAGESGREVSTLHGVDWLSGGGGEEYGCLLVPAWPSRDRDRLCARRERRRAPRDRGRRL